MDIEEDIKKVKELNNLLKFFKTHGWIPNLSRNTNINETIEAIEHILAEREEDKKRIKELEVLEDDLKDKRIVYVDTPEFEEKFIAKQKVKDKIKELKQEKNRRVKLGIFILKDYENQHILGEISSLEELLEEE